ncbi:hypothetical protein [Aurantiacibacter zhengii]|uniref:Uncharacterized protein n=1 Tax=Aurantiacibacter zhengii TaxID=2307003 RepID=A0A418NU99_9SPHN|nr:hypothetical protein [Aurantiacibacter zhengii]RIV87510.1 hypothetical protein D2V07_03930 [Aurantiacibacter zhengii]
MMPHHPPPVDPEPFQATMALLAAVLGAFGFAAPLSVVAAGFVFATVGGVVGLAFLPVAEQDERMLWGICRTLLAAWFIGGIAGMLQPHIGGVWMVPEWVSNEELLPAVMGLAGLVSRFVARKLSNGDFSLPWNKGGQ